MLTRRQASSSYFLGNKENDTLQRVYGVSFPDKQQMKEHEKFVAAAAERDHRKIGRVRGRSFILEAMQADHAQEQELFFFHDLSPGSCFWLPHGARIYNTLLELQKVRFSGLVSLESFSDHAHRASTTSAASKKSSARTCTTSTSGSSPATGRTTGRTCSRCAGLILRFPDSAQSAARSLWKRKTSASSR